MLFGLELVDDFTEGEAHVNLSPVDVLFQDVTLVVVDVDFPVAGSQRVGCVDFLEEGNRHVSVVEAHVQGGEVLVGSGVELGGHDLLLRLVLPSFLLVELM